MMIAAVMPLQAQQNAANIKGSVVDAADNSPLPFATVAVLKADSSVVTGAVTDEAGRFNIQFSASSTYDGLMLSVSFIGYKTHYQPLDLKAGKDLGKILLYTDATTLQTVQVTAKAPVIEQQADKLVMNVAQSAFAQGNTALDLLRKAPGVSVDKDGNVLLNGQAVSVWIDGRPSHLDGKSLEAMLRGTDGSSIDKIEIIANPSAKYDAAGQAGIINIKSKKTLAEGLNGTISANVGDMFFGREVDMLPSRTSNFFSQDVNVNLNYRTEHTNTFFQISEQTNPIGVDVQSTTSSSLGGVDFLQKSNSIYDAQTGGMNLKLGSDWFIDKNNTLGFIFTMPSNFMHQSADTDANRSYQSIGGIPTQQVMSYAATAFDMRQYMGNINYTHTFNPAKMAELTANIDYMHNVQESDNDLRNYFLTPTPALLWNTPIDSIGAMTLHSDNVIDVYSAKVDWQSLVLNMFMMEAGAKWALSKTDNNMHRMVSTTYPGTSTTNVTNTDNPFDYSEQVAALYATLATQPSPQWTVKIGLRGEYTYAYNSLGTVCQNYFNLFPTAFVGYNTPDFSKRFNLSYTRRIQRPHFSQLNPFENYIDAHTANVGNPDLKPCYSDNVYLTAGFGRYVTVYASFMNISDQISHTPLIDLATGDQKLRADNFGTTRLLGGGLTLAELPLGKQFTLLVNAGAYDYHNYSPAMPSLVVGQAGGDAYDVHSFYGSFYGCLTWNLPKQWKVQLDGFVSSPVTSGYMHVNWNYMCNLGLKKTALDGRLLLSLNINDLFRTMNANFDIVAGQGVESSYKQRYLMQKVTVGLQWNFGATQKPLKQRKVGALDEASRAGGGGVGANVGTVK